MATAESGKLITWGSTDDLGQSYVTSGKHGETPQPFPLPPEVCVQKAEAGWAHCVAVTENQEVYTWGWRECIPTGRVFGQVDGDSCERNISLSTEQVSPSSQGRKSRGGTSSQVEARDEPTKKRRISPSKQAAENASQSDNIDLSALELGLSVLLLVWGWGYGGEGQLGLGSRVRLVSSPHPIPCIEPSSYEKATSSGVNMSSEVQCGRVLGSYVKKIACGGRHSAVITAAATDRPNPKRKKFYLIFSMSDDDFTPDPTKAKTSVFWDVEDFPSPNGVSFYDIIKSAIEDEGYRGEVSIRAYGEKKREEYNLYDGVVTFEPKRGKYGRLNKMLMDIALWSVDNPAPYFTPANLMLWLMTAPQKKRKFRKQALYGFGKAY
ncbi:Regulator of chromosome condensation RCC1 [Arabidopsis thaliana x Arabidopsis arenosa]|uniref:Regulator of chromosome condensation RCC1 n=1 Tax=Arabidopsis thaliana x Arabidopsis arenosa TaxID=1240361 RepID=A0A8T1ZS61_9BRAS|nr:Regulator of chromosome condensation RCC1 [Arabidopsis thaliana x Arabidopsis arenosa]